MCSSDLVKALPDSCGLSADPDERKADHYHKSAKNIRVLPDGGDPITAKKNICNLWKFRDLHHGIFAYLLVKYSHLKE